MLNSPRNFFCNTDSVSFRVLLCTAEKINAGNAPLSSRPQWNAAMLPIRTVPALQCELQYERTYSAASASASVGRILHARGLLLGYVSISIMYCNVVELS